MSFSASPLVPNDQDNDVDGDTWARTARSVVAAVTEALPQIPSPAPLTPDTPEQDVAAATLPDPAGAAMTAYIGGGIEGKMLLVVGQELVDALAGTPFGAVEPHQALKPAMETIATELGGRLEGDPTSIAVTDALEVLAGGTVVLVPLSADSVVAAFVGVSLDAGSTPGPTGSATTDANSGSAAGAAAGAAGTSGGSDAATAASAARSWGIDMLRDVEMEVTCELGRTRMTVRQLLALAPGDVVELDRLAGSPADLLVNGTLLARGEVVVVDEGFGLRITEIVTKDAT